MLLDRRLDQCIFSTMKRTPKTKREPMPLLAAISPRRSRRDHAPLTKVQAPRAAACTDRSAEAPGGEKVTVTL